ncbi:hypothetical protein ACFQ0B_81920 [Nonomuraea thailandensis]
MIWAVSMAMTASSAKETASTAGLCGPTAQTSTRAASGGRQNAARFTASCSRRRDARRRSGLRCSVSHSNIGMSVASSTRPCRRGPSRSRTYVPIDVIMWSLCVCVQPSTSPARESTSSSSSRCAVAVTAAIAAAAVSIAYSRLSRNLMRERCSALSVSYSLSSTATVSSVASSVARSVAATALLAVCVMMGISPFRFRSDRVGLVGALAAEVLADSPR